MNHSPTLAAPKGAGQSVGVALPDWRMPLMGYAAPIAAPRIAYGKAVPRGDGATAVVPPRSAGNDAVCDADADPAHDVGSWARHASAANGFGGDTAVAIPLSYRLFWRARAHRAAYVGELIAAAVCGILAAARRTRDWYRQQQEARAMRNGLYELDDRALRDLGFTRSEIASVVAEATGGAEWTRLRTRWMDAQP